MRLQFKPRFLASFFILVLLLHEIHELGHHLSARLICGCWGSRDFLYWKLCDTCNRSNAYIFVELAGPFITFVFLWAGFFLLRQQNPVQKKCWGFALVLACLPLPKLLALADRGGDEINAMRKIFAGHESFKSEGVVIGILIVLILTLPPLWRAFISIQNKNRLLIFFAFLILPFLLDGLIIARLLNGLAHDGFLMTPVFFGTPQLIILWEILLVIAFLFTAKNIQSLINRD